MAEGHKVAPLKRKLWIVLGVLDVMDFHRSRSDASVVRIADHAGLAERVVTQLHRTQLVAPSVRVV